MNGRFMMVYQGKPYLQPLKRQNGEEQQSNQYNSSFLLNLDRISQIGPKLPTSESCGYAC